MKKRLLFLLACLALITGAAMARTIKGVVLDASDNEPLIGASVVPVGGGQGVATDIDGAFTLNVPDNVKKATINYVGYTPVTVDLKDGMIVKLQSAVEQLDELVVVAYGQQKKSAVTGSVSQVNADKIAVRPVASVTSALEGTTSGITISSNYGEAGSSPSIIIRGIGTVNGSTSPLYVIDGVPYGGNISDLNPNDIESLSVLKDAASAALYGNRASNGVILITTKTARDKDKIRVNFKTSQGWYERAIPEHDQAGIPEWMEAQFKNFRNSNYISKQENFDWSDPAQMAKANDYARANFVGLWTYLNIWDVENKDLFDENGNFNRNASIKGTYGEDLDWWDQAIRKGYRGSYDLSVMGATNKSDYSFSLSYLSENGYMRDNSFDRITGRASVNVNPVSWLKTGFKINVSHQNNHGTMNGVGDGGSSYNNAFFFCRYMSPIYPVHDHDLTTGNYPVGELSYNPGWMMVDADNGTQQQVNTRNQYNNRNVIWEAEASNRKTIRNTMNGTAYLNFILPYGFTAMVLGNLNTRNSDYFSYSSALIGDAYKEGALSKTLYTYKNYTFQQQLSWRMTYNDVHNINVLLGHENYAYHYDYTYASKRGQAFEGIPALSNFSEMKSVSGYRSSQNTESYLGRVQYNYDDRYNIEGSFRRDGTSRFAPDCRWGNFGSLGANWVFSNEDFIKSNASWLNRGKLFVNWGQVGNDGSAGYYAYFPLMGSTTQDQLPGYYLTQLAADDLKWETAEEIGVGVEATLFGRWNISAEFYNKNNRDLIFSVNLPGSAGPDGTGVSHPTIDKNIGSIRNRGVEISTDVDVFKNKDWRINVGTNLSFNQNRVTKLPDENKYLIGYDKEGNELLENGYLSGSYKISEGHSRYEYYTYHWAGVDQMTGHSLYDADLQKYYIKESDGTIIGGIYQKDNAGNLVLDTDQSTQLKAANFVKIGDKYYVNNYTYAKRDWAGNTLPTVQGSFDASVRYKGLSLSAMFTFSLGGKIWDSTYANLISAGNSPSALSADILNSWEGIPAGMTADSPDRISRSINPIIDYNDQYSNSGSDRWLISRNYICFKNLNVAYSFPKQLVKNLSLEGISVNFQAENLFISTKRKGMNPQMNIGGGQGNYLVPSRVFTFGLSLDI